MKKLKAKTPEDDAKELEDLEPEEAPVPEDEEPEPETSKGPPEGIMTTTISRGPHQA